MVVDGSGLSLTTAIIMHIYIYIAQPWHQLDNPLQNRQPPRNIKTMKFVFTNLSIIYFFHISLEHHKSIHENFTSRRLQIYQLTNLFNNSVIIYIYNYIISGLAELIWQWMHALALKRRTNNWLTEKLSLVTIATSIDLQQNQVKNRIYVCILVWLHYSNKPGKE